MFDSLKNPDTAESDELKRGFCGTVVALDETAGTELKRGRGSPVPHPAALVPLDNVQSRPKPFGSSTVESIEVEIAHLVQELSGSGVGEGLGQTCAPRVVLLLQGTQLFERIGPALGPGAAVADRTPTIGSGWWPRVERGRER